MQYSLWFVLHLVFLKKHEMKNSIILLLAINLLLSCQNKQVFQQNIITSDIDNFWEAYDKIVATKDSTAQMEYLEQLFLDKGTLGLNNIMAVRKYTPKEYLAAINNYPKFWASIRANTLKSKSLDVKINHSIEQLKELYPALKPADIYFTIGAFRTNGTILSNTVLIGCEMSCADHTTIIDELPEWRQPFFKEYQPLKNIDLLCTHEYVHTQQKPLADNLLSYCLYEGVAEFVSTKAIDKPSTTPAVQFGKNNEQQVKTKFESDLFRMGITNNWLWGTNKNELKIRDLGYYIGYAICEKYYEQAEDKTQAIEDMIELDFYDESQIESFVDQSGFLSKSLTQLYEEYEASRPTVINMEPFENGSQNIDPTNKRITLNFSAPMNTENRGFDYGPLGEEQVLKVQNVIGFSEDKKSFTFEIKLEPNKHYQSLVTNRFLSESGIPLKAFLIDFKTTSK